MSVGPILVSAMAQAYNQEAVIKVLIWISLNFL